MSRRTREIAQASAMAVDAQRRRTQGGFTLLEAIVAIAIVGIALVPILTFISQMVGALTRAGDVNARNLAEQSIIELLEPLNPLEQPVGEDQLGDLTIKWESENIIPPNKGPITGAGLAGFSVGFYTVTVNVERLQKGPWFSFTMRKVGYKRFDVLQMPGMPGAPQ